MKIKSTLFFLFFVVKSYCQVGINTTNPQRALHVGGTTSTIRIDGLNSTNNSGNTGNSTPVSVDSNGDLVLTPTSKIVYQSSDFIPTGVVINSSTGASVSNSSLASTTFTLAKSTLVCINYTLSIDDIRATSSTLLTDGIPRFLFSYIVLDGTRYGDNSTVYSAVTASGTLATGYMYLNGTHFAQLSSGTHTVSLGGAVYGGAYSIRARFGSDIDEIQVVAMD